MLLLDNATYHKSSLILGKFEQLGIPILFLGPYSFDLAPVERFFSFIKSRNLGNNDWNMNVK